MDRLRRGIAEAARLVAAMLPSHRFFGGGVQSWRSSDRGRLIGTGLQQGDSSIVLCKVVRVLIHHVFNGSYF